MPEGIRAMPVIAVTDVAAAAKTYARAAGFEPAGFWRDGDGRETFAILRLGRITLALRRAEAVAPFPGWAAYLYVERVGEVADLARAAGLAVEGPADRPWGCREVEITDRDGNCLCFAEDLRPGPDGPGL
jgi:hypothetical protein